MDKGQPIRPPEMRNIERQGSSEGTSWLVNNKRGSPKRAYAKSFAFSRYADEEAALAAAQAWRDEMERLHPKLTKKKHATKLIKSNTSGKTGVMRVSAISRRTDGTEIVICSWQAKSPAAIKPRRTRSFSVEKNGEQEAYRLAVEARLAFEALLDDKRVTRIDKRSTSMHA